MANLILKRLHHLNEITKSELEAVSDLDLATLRDNSYGWSVIQVFSHLNLVEHTSLLYMQKKIKAGDNMPDTNRINSFRMKLTKLVLQSKLKWKAPGYVSSPPNDFSLEEIETKWMQTRYEIEQFIRSYPDIYLGKAVFKHPMAGRLNLSDAVDSFYYHLIHHRHQIKRIRKALEKHG